MNKFYYLDAASVPDIPRHFGNSWYYLIPYFIAEINSGRQDWVSINSYENGEDISLIWWKRGEI